MSDGKQAVGEALLDQQKSRKVLNHIYNVQPKCVFCIYTNTTKNQRCSHTRHNCDTECQLEVLLYQDILPVFFRLYVPDTFRNTAPVVNKPSLNLSGLPDEGI